MTFEGKKIVVTGAAGGIGKETASYLFDRGASVALCDMNTRSLSELVETLGGPSDRLMNCELDITDETAVRSTFARIDTSFNGIDGLAHVAAVNRAGPTSEGPLFDVSDNDWQRVVDINLLGAIACNTAAFSIFVRQGHGTIVNVDSIVSTVPRIDDCAYGISKAALRMFTRCSALERARHGIRVNGVAPGPTNTEMLKAATHKDPKLLEKMVKGDKDRFRLGIALGKPGEPRDVAAAIAFLLSEDAKHITGAILSVDGMSHLVGLY